MTSTNKPQEIARFQEEGRRVVGNETKIFEIVVRRFDAGKDDGGGVEVVAFDEKGNEKNFVSFNPFAMGREIMVDNLSHVFFSGDFDFGCPTINRREFARLRKREQDLETVIEAQRIVNGGKE